ncbi:MAG: YegS/Rv2252/BmrU family lipid kinase [Clostridia bacterium]|nr:YegS/Rv2252/BmrU family lipid kinase [Clostridia bacterium]
MKHIFIVNPAAGKENATEAIQQGIEASAYAADCEIYLTKAPGDATAYIRSYCESNTAPVRFYACGGDGTLNEVVNGVAGFAHASLGCYPCGSGNDFVKYYGGKKYFLNIPELLEAKEEYIDLMRVGDKYSINATHFGFDSCVARIMTNVRRKKLIGGKNAYTTGIVVGLFKAMKNKCKVTVDGEWINPKGTILLCTVANGQYVGGSFRAAPRSVNNDGLLEICLVEPVSHFTFLSLMGEYQKGTHIDNPKFEKFLTYRRGKTIRVEAPEGFVYCLDGEVIEGHDFTVQILPQALRFAVPKSAMPLIADGHVPCYEKEPVADAAPV